MTLYKAYNPDVQVLGQTVLSVVDGMGVFKSLSYEVLKRNGIVNPKPSEWYSQQAWLNSFQMIAKDVGGKTLHKIGLKIPLNAQWPPQIKGIHDALASVDVAYHMNHRLNGQVLFNQTNNTMQEGIGHYAYKRTGDSSAMVLCDNPYPCEFDMGILEAVAEKFKQPNVPVVTIEHGNTEDCRKTGANSCAYLIKW